MSKKIVTKKTKSIKKIVIKSPKKKKAFKLKHDPKLPTPIVPKEYTEQYEKERAEFVDPTKLADLVTKYADQVDTVNNVAKDRRIEKLGKLLVQEVKLSEEDKTAWTSFFGDKDPDFKVMVHESIPIDRHAAHNAEVSKNEAAMKLEKLGMIKGPSIRKLDDVSTTADWKKFEDSGAEEFRKTLDVLSDNLNNLDPLKEGGSLERLKARQKIEEKLVEKAPSRPMKEVIVKNQDRLDKNLQALQDTMDDNRKMQELEKEAVLRSQQTVYSSSEPERKPAASRISREEYLSKYKNLENDVFQELDARLTKRNDVVEKAQKQIEDFEKSIGEKTAAYHKARREYLTITKIYEEATEQIFGKK